MSGLVPKLRFPEFKNSPPWQAQSLNELTEHLQERVRDGQLPTVSITAGTGFVTQIEKFGKDISGAQYKNYIHLRRGDFSYNRGNSKRFAQGCVYPLKELDEVAAPNAFISFRLKPGHEIGFFQAQFEKNAHGQQLAKFITSGARSDGLLNISPEQFFSIKLPLPPDDAEQRKIAECLTSLDELIAAEGRRLEALRTWKKALLQNLFPRPERIEGGVKVPAETTPRLRFPEFDKDGEWKQERLGQLGRLIGGLTYSPDDVREEGLLVLRSSNIREGQISLEDCVHVRPDVDANISEPNDILICVRNGSKPLIGKNAMIPSGLPRCTHGAFMTVFRAEAPHFVHQLFQTSEFRKQVAGDLGATINSINGKNLLNYRFIVPSRPEQSHIASCLGSLDALITEQSKMLDTLKLHKQGLMQFLFPSPEAL